MAAELSIDVPQLQGALAHWLTHDATRGLIVTDTQLRIAGWNRWMEIHSGRAAIDVIGRSLLDVYPELARPVMREYFDGALEGSVTVVSHGLHRFLITLPPTNPHLDLAEMPQSGHIGPLGDGTTVIGTVMSIEDVSERLATEIALRKQIEAQRAARATAEQALRDKEEFLSTLSHEMRTPLNAVLGWARILLGRKTLDPDLVGRALQVIARNAAAQAKMIDDMLDMARIVVGKLQLETKMVDVVSIVLAAVDVVTPSAEAKRLAIETDLDPAIPIMLADPDRLQQIVVNILSNAVKFTDAGGSIAIRLDMDGQALRLAVQDTGRGISPAFLPHVFERFRQSDSSSTRRHGGLGLGLGLVRELVELHGGSVQAESPGEGRGACFTVRIPARTTPGVRRRNSVAIPEVGSLDGVRVLVIDDEPDARELAVAALESGGAEVLAVASSADAVSGIVRAPANRLPHVVVSDIGMPVEDGYAFIRQLRALPPDHGGRIPAVTLTGYGAHDDVNRVLAAGYQMHVAKPIDPSSLVAVVARLSKTVV